MPNRHVVDPDRKRELKQARDRKLYRRQLAGRACCQVEFTSEIVNYLVKYEWLDKANAKAPTKAKAKDRDNIGDAISRAMQDAAEADAK